MLETEFYIYIDDIEDSNLIFERGLNIGPFPEGVKVAIADLSDYHIQFFISVESGDSRVLKSVLEQLETQMKAITEQTLVADRKE